MGLSPTTMEKKEAPSHPQPSITTASTLIRLVYVSNSIVHPLNDTHQVLLCHPTLHAVAVAAIGIGRKTQIPSGSIDPEGIRFNAALGCSYRWLPPVLVAGEGFEPSTFGL